jgi:hypothetical protein
MAKKNPEGQPASEGSEAKEIGVYRDPKTKEVTDLVLPFPNAKTPKEVAANYFVEHEQYTLDEVIVCDDSTVFPGTQKGQNAAINYCAAKGIGQHTVSR